MGRISLRPYSTKTYWPAAGSGRRSRVSRGGIQPLRYRADFVGGRRNLDWCNASIDRFWTDKRKTIGRPNVGSGFIHSHVEFQEVKRARELVRWVQAETHSRQFRSGERSWPQRRLQKRNSLR